MRQTKLILAVTLAVSCGGGRTPLWDLTSASGPVDAKPDGFSSGSCRTCRDFGAICGAIDDGCGHRLSCGDCPWPTRCGADGVANRCGCKPATCSSISAYCGTQLDGCGGTLSCGVCEPDDGRRGNHNGDKVCIGAGPANCSEEGVTCTPTTCAKAKAQCGKLADGCGQVLDCGTCAAPLVCGGSGIANQCGCKPLTCKAAGANCGVLNDGCGTSLYCGDCPSGLTCDPETHRCALATGI